MKNEPDKKQYTRDQSKNYLIATTITTVLICVFWYPAILLPIAMSFDSGYKISMILIDITAVTAPIIFLIIPVLLGWLAFSKTKYHRCIKWLWINWLTIIGVVGIFLAYWLVIIGAILIQS